MNETKKSKTYNNQKLKTFFSFRKKLILVFGLLLVVTSITQTILAERYASMALLAKIETSLLGKTRDTARIIEERIEIFVQTLKEDAKMPFLRDKTLSMQEKADILYELKGGSKDFLYISVSDEKGLCYMYNSKPFDTSSQEWFPATMKGATYISEPVLDILTNKLIMIFSTPIYDHDSIIGTINVCLPALWLSKQIQDSTIGKTGYAYVIGEKGTQIAVGKLEHFDIVKERWNTIKESENNEDLASLATLEKKLYKE